MPGLHRPIGLGAFLMLIGLLALALMSSVIAVSGWPGMRVQPVAHRHTPHVTERV